MAPRRGQRPGPQATRGDTSPYCTTAYCVGQGDVAVGSRWNFVMGRSNAEIGFPGIPISKV